MGALTFSDPKLQSLKVHAEPEADRGISGGDGRDWGGCTLITQNEFID